MEQRRLRLGDIVDDYCPRERRVTNHAVVAMIEDEIKQTRCTTCDAEHAYKGGRAPRRRKAESTGALYKEVLAGITAEDAAAGSATPMSAPQEERIGRPETEETPDTPLQAAQPADEPGPAAEPEQTEPDSPADEGPVHRPLIRAQLPRPEGMKVERTVPEFTIRQNAGRPGNFRRDGGMRPAGRNNNGHQRFGRGPQRGGGGGGQRSGSGSGSGRRRPR